MGSIKVTYLPAVFTAVKNFSWASERSLVALLSSLRRVEDNSMITGYIMTFLAAYEKLIGDTRYSEKGSLLE